MKYATAATVVFALFAGAGSCFAQESPVVAPALAFGAEELRRGAATREKREGGTPAPAADLRALLHKYVWSAQVPARAIDATLASGLEQGRDAQSEWGAGATGYAKRWASAYGEAAIRDATEDVVARMFHHDPSFARCECSGFTRRFRHAISSPFMARKPDGTRVLSPATIAGLFAGHVLPASLWYPAPLGARDGLEHAGAGILGKIGADLFLEFTAH